MKKRGKKEEKKNLTPNSHLRNEKRKQKGEKMKKQRLIPISNTGSLFFSF